MLPLKCYYLLFFVINFTFGINLLEFYIYRCQYYDEDSAIITDRHRSKYISSPEKTGPGLTFNTY